MQKYAAAYLNWKAMNFSPIINTVQFYYGFSYTKNNMTYESKHLTRLHHYHPYLLYI
jgi:hypothetical protein